MTEKISLEPIISKIDRLNDKVTDLSVTVATNNNVEKERHDTIQHHLHSVSEKIEEQSKHLSVYNDSLKEHVRRTDIAEKNLKFTQKMVYIIAVCLGFVAIETVPASILKSAVSLILSLFV